MTVPLEAMLFLLQLACVLKFYVISRSRFGVILNLSKFAVIIIFCCFFNSLNNFVGRQFRGVPVAVSGSQF